MSFYGELERIRTVNAALQDDNFFSERGYCVCDIPKELKSLSFPVRSPLPLIKKQYNSILDIGCGCGLDLFLMKKASFESSIWGIDISYPLLNEGRKIHGLKVCQASAIVLPFKDKKFDLVTLNGVFNQIYDKESLVKEIVRVLKSDGSVIVSDLFAKVKNLKLPEDADEFNLLNALEIEDIFRLFKIFEMQPTLKIIENDYTKEFGIFSICFVGQ